MAATFGTTVGFAKSVAVNRIDERVAQRGSDLLAGGAPIDLPERLQGDDALRHGTVSATDPKPLDDGAYDIPRGAHVTHVANREDEVGTDGSSRDRPFGALRLESEIRDLRDHLFADTPTSVFESARPSARRPLVGSAGRSMRRSRAGLWLACR